MGIAITRLTQDRTIEESYADLAGAICAEAVREYMTAYKAFLAGSKKIRTDLFLLESFFRSEWYLFLTQGAVDGEYIIEEAQKRCRTSKNISDRTSLR